MFLILLTLKKVIVDPPSSVPYEILLCSARSSTLSMGVIMRSTVRKAARLAVYEEIMMSVKNHQMAPMIRVDVAFGFRSHPWCINVTIVNQKLQTNTQVRCNCPFKISIKMFLGLKKIYIT